MSKHEVNRLIPEWFNAHRAAVVWYSPGKEAFIRYVGNEEPVVIR